MDGTAKAFATHLCLTLAASGPALAQGRAAEVTHLDPITIDASRSAVPVPGKASVLPLPLPGGQVASGAQLGILGNRDTLTSPFSITGYTSKLIADTQARSIADVAANDPSVRLAFPRSGHRDVYSIRGFNLFSYNTGFDGLYGIAPKQRYPAELAERIEILKGPDTFLNGAAPGESVGGAINIIPKRATDEPITTITTSYVSDGEFGTHLDYGRRFGAHKEFGIRVNGLARNGDLSVDHLSGRLGAAALGLDYQGDRLRLYGDFGVQQNQTNAPEWTATLAPGVTAIPVPASTTSLSQPWARIKSQDAYGALRAEYDLSDSWTAFGAFGVSTTKTTGIHVQPTFLKTNGDFTGAIAAFPSSGLHYSGQIGLRGQFETGPVLHNMTVALARWDQSLKAGYTRLGSFTSDIFNPVIVPQPDSSSVIDLDSIHPTAKHRYSSLVLADTLEALDGRLQLSLGGRWQNIESTNFAATTGAKTSHYDRSKISPAAGLVYKLDDSISLYGNYAEALQQGLSAPRGAANFGETFAPAVSWQVEAGVKVDRGSWMTSLAAFQITQPTGLIDPATNIYTQDGEQRNRGLEFNIAGEPFQGVRVLGGATFLDGRLTRTAGGIYDGKKAVGSPDYLVNLGVEWDAPFAQGLTLSARMIHTGRQFADSANTQVLDRWTRFDIGARYVVKRRNGAPITMRVAVENLFDRDYWASASAGRAGGISRGAPQTFLASTTFQF